MSEKIYEARLVNGRILHLTPMDPRSATAVTMLCGAQGATSPATQHPLKLYCEECQQRARERAKAAAVGR